MIEADERASAELEPEGVARSGSAADQLVDELLPFELDWRRLVGSYPLATVTLAALGGFLLGRSRGAEIVAALSSFAADSVVKNVNSLLGEEIL